MKAWQPKNRLFGILFLLTGIFAIVGGLYTWGEGSIFEQDELAKVRIPWADTIVTGPLSLVCGYGLMKKKNWAQVLGLATSGIYIFGSVLVFISMIWEGDYPIFLTVPASSGMLIGSGYIVLSLAKSSPIPPSHDH